MSPKKSTELQNGAVNTALGIGLLALGGCLETATAPMGSIPETMIGLGVIATGFGTATLSRRLSRRGRARARFQNPGWANRRQLRRCLSASAALRVARYTRPSLEHLTWWNTPWYARQIPTTDYGIYVGKSVVGPEYARDIWISYKDVTLVIAPPQSGKTAWLAGAIIDAAGAVVATSTKIDLYNHTYQLRQTDDRPVYLFNPEQVGGTESTFRWDPVAGCLDPDTAQRRAEALVQGTRAAEGVDHGGFFESQAAKVLRALLMAAALENRGMQQVAEWVSNPGSGEPELVLRQHADQVPAGWVAELGQVLRSSADKTRESIFLTISLATAFMSNPSVARLCTPGAGENFDLADFLNRRGTLHLVGEGRMIAPLVTALTSYLFDGAKQYASEQPSGRLDPPAMFALDEAALIVPVDLDRWVSDAGGRNVTIVIVAQSLSQLYKVWGERGGETIKNNSNLEIYFGGMSVASDAQAISALCGDYEQPAISETDGNGRAKSTTTSKIRRPTLPVDALRELPDHHVLVLYRNARPTIARTVPVWERKDVKRLRRAERQMAKARAKAEREQLKAKIPTQRAPEDTNTTTEPTMTVGGEETS